MNLWSFVFWVFCEIKIQLYVYMGILKMSRCMMQICGFFSAQLQAWEEEQCYGQSLRANLSSTTQSTCLFYSCPLLFRKLWPGLRNRIWKWTEHPHLKARKSECSLPLILLYKKFVVSKCCCICIYKKQNLFCNVQDQNYHSDLN